jgi:hypothetical protein
MARDIVLEFCQAMRPPRGTRDLDIGVEVSGWEEFQRISEGLLATGKFKAMRDFQGRWFLRCIAHGIWGRFPGASKASPLLILISSLFHVI